MTFDTADTGATYTLTSSSGTITVLDGFTGQTWSPSLSTVNNIPGTVTSIGAVAFYYCTSLTSITIPSTVTTIGSSAFDSSIYLTSITIPSSVTSIGESVFQNCSSLVAINVDSGNPNYSSVDGNLYNFAQNILIQYSIGKTASSFSIPSTVTTISFAAFGLSTYLTSITIPSSVTTIGAQVFIQCISLTSITIPSSVTSIGEYVFYNCASLATINVDSGNPNYSSVDGNLYNFAQNILIQYSIGKTDTSFSIPTTVTTIGITAFNYSRSLTSITIPSSVTSIGIESFVLCSSLADITIPSSVTSIGTNAFYGIPNLSSTIVTTPITPTPSYAYTWFHTEPDFSSYYSNITFQDPDPIICFKEDTKILTDKGYIPIQNLRNGDLVKTINHNYVPINMIGKREIHHSALKERIKDQLYKCSQTDYPEIFEDLIITGCHSILVDEFKAGEREKTIEVLDRIFVTDRKYRLPACVDERASVYEVSGYYTIYHIALENDDYRMNYGIYANGLLVESCSKRHMKELSKMELL